MIKKTPIFFYLILATNLIFSQQPSLPQQSIPSANAPFSPGKQFWAQDYTTHFKMIDPSTGSLFKNTYDEIEGFPFFLEEWKYTLIKLSNGGVFDLVSTRFNLYTKELHFKTDSEIELAFPAGYVKQFSIYSSPDTKKILYEFESGFPPIDNQNQNTSYQVILRGKITLLKLTQKRITVNKNDLSGEITKRFITYDNYYLYSNNEIKKFSKDKNSILNILPDKKEKVEEFSREHSTNFKNMDDIKLLLAFYNSIAL